MRILGSWRVNHFVFDDGILPPDLLGVQLQVWRALDPTLGLVHLLLPKNGLVDTLCVTPLVGEPLSLSPTHLMLPYRPGVSLLDVLAQGQMQGGELPVEAAVFVVVELARTVARLHAIGRRAPGSGLAQYTRVGFDGGTALWAFGNCRVHRPPGAPDDDDDGYDNRIGIFSMADLMRMVPREEATAPEEIDALGDLRSDVFILGGLLWMVLTGAHPFARSNLLQSLDVLRAAELPPLGRDLPAPLVRLLRSALALDPAARPQSADAFARSLALFVDDNDGRAATAALVRGLFPNSAEMDTAFAEEAALVDVAALITAPPPPPPPERRITPTVITGIGVSPPPPPTLLPVPLLPTLEATRVWLPRGGVAADIRLVTNGDVVEFLRVHQRPAPPGFEGADPQVRDQPATMVSAALAAEVALFRGGRLPTEDEWTQLARGGGLGVASVVGVIELCQVWEWTTTPARQGFVVRGGPWRNREERGLVDNRSWEDEAAPDLGFRVVLDHY
ncbi:MAG: hypothetical protein Q8O67_07255 [Deltaproteobacteria bacterium]|nr:hypothetical protein [Deltaproteobacteria bacterium]